MISATPNSVRWDQVNRVTYRFQALNFQSDVLEALVLNSPPLSRRSRRKPIIRGSRSDYSGNKVEFLKARSLERRSLSFDEGIADNQKSDLKFYEKSRVSHDRYVSGRAVHSHVVFEPRRRAVFEAIDNVSHCKGTKDRQKLENFENADSVSCLSVVNTETDEKLDEDLDKKSKESLIELINDLRNEIRELKGNGDQSSPCSEKKSDSKETVDVKSKPCCRCNSSGVCLEQPESPAKKDHLQYDKDLLYPHMQQLEFEIRRTRKIATMFEEEITGLKDRFSNVLVRTNHLTKNKCSAVNPVALERTEKLDEMCNGVSSVTEERDSHLSQNETNDKCDESSTSMIKLDTVSVIG
ncbi:uncharacterized protein LOC135695501 [Rhopilema esculentum]|uniref:uncharacterized protein LOC135695501 n=1 Tax=Rhopilema esculentum TaxID=499914 RepID=UPI0031DEA489